MSKKIFLIIICLFVIFVALFYIRPFSGDKKNATITSEKTSVSVVSNTEETTQEKLSDLPGDSSSWELVLVNEANKIEEEPTDLEDLPNGLKVEQKIYEPYMELSEAAKDAGYELTVISAYRSVQDQIDVVATDVEMYMNQGYSEDEAREKAMEYLTVPGLSEHHTGLALDVISIDWFNQGHSLEESFGDSEAGKWLADNASDYGFIIRYQKGKEDITGINYEPWHIRYVGKENAKYMTEHDLTLEEYIEQLKKVGK